MKSKCKWILCPVCGNKTRLQIRNDTELKNFPLYCPKCRQESLIDVNKFKIRVITEPDAKTQSYNTENEKRFLGYRLILFEN